MPPFELSNGRVYVSDLVTNQLRRTRGHLLADPEHTSRRYSFGLAVPNN